MAVTRLERKVKRRRILFTKKQQDIKRLLKSPVIKNVDIDVLKAAFPNSETQSEVDVVAS
jgi:hypothetical protein